MFSFKIIINDEERVSGEIARSFFEKYSQLDMNIPYVNVTKPYSPESAPYHVKSMVLYGDPAMPLALNTSSLNKEEAQKQAKMVPDLPEKFALKSNYPNPFNPTTQIAYDLPQDCRVTITIYNIQGRKIKTLIASHQSAGYKSIKWNSRDQHGNQVSTGVYIYKMQTSTDFEKTNKMMFIK